jgi:hypothetical protein
MQSAKAVNRYKMSCHAGHSRYLFGSGGLPTLVALLLSTRHLVAFVRGRAGLDRRVSLDPGRRVLLIGSVEGSGGYVSQASQSMRVSRCESVDASQSMQVKEVARIETHDRKYRLGFPNQSRARCTWRKVS